MLRSPSGRNAARRTRGSTRLATIFPAAAALLLGSCGGGEGGGNPVGTDGTITAAVTVNVTPTLSSVAGDPDLAPTVTSARVVLADASGGVRLDTVIAIGGAPTSPFILRPTLTSRTTSGVTAPVALTMRVELRSGTGASVEWSGRQSVSLVPGSTANVTVNFFRGPLPNLDVTSVELDPAGAPLDEGGVLAVTARVGPTGLDGTTIYLRSLDPTIASFATPFVTGTTASLTLHLPGTARVVAASGQFADTIVVTVLARVASVQLSSGATLTLASLGDTAQVTASALDPRGAEIPGAALEWIVANPALLTSLSLGATGRVRAEANGSTMLTVRSVRNPSATASVPVVVRQVAQALQRIARPAAQATAGQPAGEFGVRVLDARGRGIAGVLVTWGADGGVLVAPTQLTDANGEAVQSWRAGSQARRYNVSAAVDVDALGARSEAFTVDVSAGRAVAGNTVVAIGAASLPADGASTTTVRVTLKDEFGNVPTSPDDAVTVAASSGALSALVRQSDGSWLATYTAPTTLGTATFTVTLPGDPPFAGGSLQLVAGPAAALVTTTATAQSATVGTNVTAVPSVRVTDAQGHPVAGVTVTFAVSAGGGAIGVTSGTSDIDGNTGVGSWTLGTVAGANTVTASTGGVPSVSFDATGTPDAPATLTFTAPPSTVVAGTQLPAVQVEVRDQHGNLLTNAATPVTIALGANPGGDVLAGAGSTTTSGGVATFAGLSLQKAASGYTLVATSGALPQRTSDGFAVTHAALHHYSVESASGGAIGTQVTGTPFNVMLAARDAFENVVTGFAGTATLDTDPAGRLTGGATTGAFTSGVLASHAVTVGTAGSVRLRVVGAGGASLGASLSFDVGGPPVAVDDVPAAASAPGDAMHVAFNTSFSLAAPGLLANDARGIPEGSIVAFILTSPTLVVTEHAAGTTVSPLPGYASGSLVVDPDGRAAFAPPTGFTGTYEFRYRLQNTAGTSTATARIAVGNRPAVSSDAYPVTLIGNVPVNTATGSGFSVRSNDQGDALVLAVTSSSNGTATLAQDGTFAFRPDAGFSGAASFTYTATNGFGTSTPATASLTVGAPLWFVDASAPAGGDGRYDTPFNCLVGPGCFDGSAADQLNARIVLEPGTYDGGMVMAAGQRLLGLDTALSFAATTGSAWVADAGPEPARGRPTVLGPSNVAIQLGADNTLRGLTLGLSTDVSLRGSAFGTLVVDRVELRNGNGGALELRDGTISGSFGAVHSIGGPQWNVLLANVGTVGTVTLGTSADVLQHAASPSVQIQGGGGTFVVPGTIDHTGQTSVAVSEMVGGAVDFSGAINPGSPGGAIIVSGNSGGNRVTFSGPAQRVSSPMFGVQVQTNAGAYVDFTGGNLQASSTVGPAIHGLNGGTVSIVGPNNVATATNAPGVSLTGTTIGVNGITLRQVNATLASEGILLAQTGSSGSFLVQGDGSPQSGGVISNTDAAVRLVDVGGRVSLQSMVLRDNVVGLQLSGAIPVDVFVDGAQFARNGTAVNLASPVGGGVVLQNSTVEGTSAHVGIVANLTGGTASLALTGVTFLTGTATPVSVSASGAASLNLTVNGSTLRAADGGAVLGYVARGAAGGLVTVNGSTLVTNGAATARGLLVQAGVGAGETYSGTTAYSLVGNQITATTGTGIVASRFARGTVAGGRLSGRITNNTIGAVGACAATGIRVDNLGQGLHVNATSGNVVPCGTDAIAVNQTSQAGLGGEIHSTITGHSFTLPAPPQAYVTSNVDAAAGSNGRRMCVDVRDNSFRFTLAFNNGILSLPGWADPTPPTTTNAEFNALWPPYITSRNRSPFSAGGTILNFTTNGDACLMP